MTPARNIVAALEEIRSGRYAIDRDRDDLHDLINFDPADFNPPSRLNDAELARSLAILDDLEMKCSPE